MSIAKVTEVKSSSTKSFDDALNQGLARASQTVKNIKGAWISEQDVLVENDKITEYRVLLKITFVVE
jgi:flavin-binding protein dodecin